MRQVGRIKREEIYRDPLGSKPEGISRLLLESFVGMEKWKTRDEKVVQGGKLARRIEAYMYCGSEPRANWAKIWHDCQLKNIFDSENKLMAVTGYNEHKKIGRVQEGGTCAMVFHELATMVDIMDVEKRSLDTGFG